jgi:hypothetical protein
MSETTHEGSCFCGTVAVRVKGAPQAMGYCHCESCRTWSASPINAFALWPLANVSVTRGEAELATYKKTPGTHRQYCKKCGGHVRSVHPDLGFTDVYASLLPSLTFKPALHVFYGERMIAMKDGLPKFKDVPKEMGGSGELLAE